MAYYGSQQGAEVEVARKTYTTRLSLIDENEDGESVTGLKDGGLLKVHIFNFTIPQVDGGSNLSIKVRWSQKIMYKDGEFILIVPYSFPEYVTPASKKHQKMEKIQLNVNSGLTTEVLCKTTSHPLKERKREPGKLDFVYEAQVLKWSKIDFIVKYHASTTGPFGSVLLQSPSTSSIDQREMFGLYLFAGPDNSTKVFRKEVVFVVDISESMNGNIIEVTKNAVIAALLKLDREDSFGIVAFNNRIYLYSPTIESATNESIKDATEWINTNFIALGGTDMSIALDQALGMFSGTSKSIPMVFFITDGSVENEKQICEDIQRRLQKKGSELSPRINTFGIGNAYIKIILF
ncbi:uncharacterized protein LOC143581525 isoform X2 [Bidens hawaiensis]|uniref:uncharacterized protein LOC143581525 isoform X2 n=1 Tax=Bidens hawaiensis TaxID=980011 RepID=UPI00404B3059